MSVLSEEIPFPDDIAARPPRDGLVRQIRSKLFATKGDTALTLFLGAIVCALIAFALDWLVIGAAAPWATVDACAEARGTCWPFVVEKHRLILFVTYPFEAQWRPFTASLLLVGGVGISMLPSFHNARLVALWGAVGVGFYVLMTGGYFGLEVVKPERWNGLPVLLMLAIFGLIFAYPVGILLSLARHQSQLPAIRAFAILYIELVRDVPMIMVLFLGLFVLPLLTTMIALVFFHSAYFAEAVRGGLQPVPLGQYEAANSQGLS
ncbi:ABC transporter permease subunit [Breoghania sp.]|uniref:ABC transporter permease subunit n=1 Tax=Breoghania sp. TaxID=2065378 RepID=UPI00262057E5|nr:ABC transporter permease subunit [Breoghania sp.]MDJ0933430.1 ABC transporter permease subunit [Breoghania sp.]